MGSYIFLFGFVLEIQSLQSTFRNPHIGPSRPRVMSATQTQDRCACSNRRPPGPPAFLQTILISDYGRLGVYRPIIQERRPRTPMPNAVRRIANQPKFSTADPSLTSFLRFPSEVRIQIYRQLLRYNGTIQYGVCSTHLCLVCREHRLGKPEEFRHRLFPAILECCRLINREGSEVLYGDNCFRIEHWDRYYYAAKTWALASGSVQFIKRIHLDQYDRAQTQVTLDNTKLFPNLQQLSVEFYDSRLKWWQDFLPIIAENLRHISRVLLVVNIDYETRGRLWWEQQNSGRTIKELCLRTYQPVLMEQIMCWKNKSVRWDFEEETDELARSYGALGKVKLFLNS